MMKKKCRKCGDTGQLSNGRPCLACGCGDRQVLSIPTSVTGGSIICAWEPLAALLDDGLAELVATHWQEVAVHKQEVPLDVDWEGYQQDEDQGVLKLLAARRDERLIGYASYYVRPHRHYKSTLHAWNDAIFVLPKERGAGLALIRAAERLLAALAAPRFIRIMYHAKMGVEAERGTFARVFERLGYAAFETTHDKVVKE